MIKGLLGGMALQLFVKGFCPNCKQKKLKQGRVVPMALEIKCSACGALYKKTPFGVHIPEESSYMHAFTPKTNTTINYDESEGAPVGIGSIQLLIKGWCPNCLQKKAALKEVAEIRRWCCSACGVIYRKEPFGVLVREEPARLVGVDYGEQPSIAGESSCAPGLPAREPDAESHYRDKDWFDNAPAVLVIGSALAALAMLVAAVGALLGWWGE